MVFVVLSSRIPLQFCSRFSISFAHALSSDCEFSSRSSNVIIEIIKISKECHIYIFALHGRIFGFRYFDSDKSSYQSPYLIHLLFVYLFWSSFATSYHSTPWRPSIIRFAFEIQMSWKPPLSQFFFFTTEWNLNESWLTNLTRNIFRLHSI